MSVSKKRSFNAVDSGDETLGPKRKHRHLRTIAYIDLTTPKDSDLSTAPSSPTTPTTLNFVHPNPEEANTNYEHLPLADSDLTEPASVALEMPAAVDLSLLLNGAVDVLLEIAPHIDVKILAKLVQAYLESYGVEGVIEAVVDQLYGGVDLEEAIESLDATESVAFMGQESDSSAPLAECGCCFEEGVSEARIVRCADGHPFCSSCVHRYASHQLGLRNARITCMDVEGCERRFPEVDLRNVLSAPLFALYERLEQRQHLVAARIEGFEECPFCNWACIMETTKEESPSFICGNGENGCGLWSCRYCMKKDHPSQTCWEATANDPDDSRQTVEEAMTAAITRKCPQCSSGLSFPSIFFIRSSH